MDTNEHQVIELIRQGEGIDGQVFAKVGQSRGPTWSVFKSVYRA